MPKKLAIVRTLSDREMSIIEDALEYWLEDNADEDAAIVAEAQAIYDELTEEENS